MIDLYFNATPFEDGIAPLASSAMALDSSLDFSEAEDIWENVLFGAAEGENSKETHNGYTYYCVYNLEDGLSAAGMYKEGFADADKDIYSETMG